MSPCRLTGRIAALAAYATALLSRSVAGDIEIDFEPVDDSGAGVGGILNLIRGGPGGGAAVADSPMPGFPGFVLGGGPHHGRMRGPAQHGREAELDHMMHSMLNSMLGPPMGMPGMDMPGPGQGFPFPGGSLQSGTMVVEGGPGGMQMVTMSGPQVSKSSVPIDMLKSLFPGPHAPGVLGQTVMMSPFDQPDPMVMNMLSDLDQAFAHDMMPVVQRLSGGAGQEPNSCQKDIAEKCSNAKSHLHCLGLHPENINDQCRRDVGKSVPFLCGRAIDRFCDVLERGVLDCLRGHTEELEGPCLDAVLTTKKVIDKVNTQKASLTDPSTGIKTVYTPSSTQASSTEREANLDKKLGLTAAAPLPQQNVAEREADLDFKLGLSKAPPPAAPATPASPPPLAPAQPASLAEMVKERRLSQAAAEQPSSWMFTKLLLCLFIVAVAAWLYVTGEFSKVLSYSTGREPEGARLVGGGPDLELPKPVD